MPKITLVLHNIRSTHNVGSIFRTAEGFGVQKIVLSGYTPHPTYINDSRLPHLSEKITKQIHKTALGAEKMVPFEYYEDIDDWLRQNRLPIVALEQTKESQSIRDYQPPGEFALLLGEEVYGVTEELLARCDGFIEIPMSGKKESFNVSVAAGIALYSLSA